MLSYDWPGNVRELENCMQHMVAINSGPLLHAAELPSMLQNHLLAKKAQVAFGGRGIPTDVQAPRRSQLARTPRTA